MRVLKRPDHRPRSRAAPPRRRAAQTLLPASPHRTPRRPPSSPHAGAHTTREIRHEESPALPPARVRLPGAERWKTFGDCRSLRPDRAKGWTQTRRFTRRSHKVLVIVRGATERDGGEAVGTGGNLTRAAEAGWGEGDGGERVRGERDVEPTEERGDDEGGIARRDDLARRMTFEYVSSRSFDDT